MIKDENKNRKLILKTIKVLKKIDVSLVNSHIHSYDCEQNIQDILSSRKLVQEIKKEFNFVFYKEEEYNLIPTHEQLSLIKKTVDIFKKISEIKKYNKHNVRQLIQELETEYWLFGYDDDDLLPISYTHKIIPTKEVNEYIKTQNKKIKFKKKEKKKKDRIQMILWFIMFLISVFVFGRI